MIRGHRTQEENKIDLTMARDKAQAEGQQLEQMKNEDLDQGSEKLVQGQDKAVVQISALCGQVAKLTCDKHDLEQEVLSKDRELKATIQAVRKKEEEIKAKEVESLVQISALRDQVKELTIAKANFQQRFWSNLEVTETAEAKEGEYKAAISALRDQRDLLASDNDALEQAVEAKNQAIKAKTEECLAAKANAKAKEEEFGVVISDLLEQVEKLTSGNNALERAAEAKDLAIRAKTEECSALNQDLEASNFEASELKRRLEAAEAAAAAERIRMELVVMKIHALDAENQSLVDQLRLQEREAATKAANEKAAAEARDAEISALTKEVETRKGQVKSLESQLAASKAQIQVLQEEIAMKSLIQMYQKADQG